MLTIVDIQLEMFTNRCKYLSIPPVPSVANSFGLYFIRENSACREKKNWIQMEWNMRATYPSHFKHTQINTSNCRSISLCHTRTYTQNVTCCRSTVTVVDASVIWLCSVSVREQSLNFILIRGSRLAHEHNRFIFIARFFYFSYPISFGKMPFIIPVTIQLCDLPTTTSNK